MPKRNTRRRLSLSHCRTRCALADRGLAIPHHELRDLAGKLGQDCPTICTQAPSLMPIHPEFAPIPDRANSQKSIPRWPPRRDHHPSLKRASLPTGAKRWLRRTPVGAELCWSWTPPFFGPMIAESIRALCDERRHCAEIVEALIRGNRISTAQRMATRKSRNASAAVQKRPKAPFTPLSSQRSY